jgi:hypothetical protein
MHDCGIAKNDRMERNYFFGEDATRNPIFVQRLLPSML